MRRVQIIGCCGSGKSTLARALSESTDLPVYHLDQYYWQPNWKETPKSEWEPIVKDLAQKDTWIIDGNYGGTQQIRFERADTIIYLRYGTFRCLGRVIKRIWKYHGTVRPDMPLGCRERFDFEFLHYVATFNLLRSKSITRLLQAHSTDTEILTLSSDNEVADYLTSLTSTT